MKWLHAISLALAGILVGVVPAGWLMLHSAPGTGIRSASVALMLAGILACAPLMFKYLK